MPFRDSCASMRVVSAVYRLGSSSYRVEMEAEQVEDWDGEGTRPVATSHNGRSSMRRID